MLQPIIEGKLIRLFNFDTTVLFSIIFIIYTTLGGYYALVWMDFVLGLMVIVFGTLFYMYAFAPVNFSLAEIGTRLAELGRAEMWSFAGSDISSSMSKFVTGCVGILAAQLYWQSCFAAKDSRTSRNGLLSSGIIAISNGYAVSSRRYGNIYN